MSDELFNASLIAALENIEARLAEIVEALKVQEPRARGKVGSYGLAEIAFNVERIADAAEEAGK